MESRVLLKNGDPNGGWTTLPSQCRIKEDSNLASSAEASGAISTCIGTRQFDEYIIIKGFFRVSYKVCSLLLACNYAHADYYLNV